MGKIFDKIDSMIANAIHLQDSTRITTFRAIKTEFLKAKTEKNAKPLDDLKEFQIINKMVKQREESAKMFEDANRLELAANEKAEISVLTEFLPEEIPDDKIEMEVLTCGIELVKSNLGSIIKIIKQKYPTADGKLVADIVKSHLN